MPQTARSRRRSRRPGKVAAKVLCVVAERRRLLAIKADLQADYDRELEALRTLYVVRRAYRAHRRATPEPGPRPPAATDEGD